jgi:NAD(P)-dependent dehydrogenase (short-subunit alcohol dehydrogenase family)
MSKPHCLVIGVGPGTGLACVRRFAAGGYAVSMIARNQGRLDDYAAAVDGASGYAVDIADLDTYGRTLERVVERHGVPKAVVYNATLATFGRFDEIDLNRFELSYRVNSTGLLVAAQVLAPMMKQHGDSALIVTGNTGSLRGKPGYVGWSPSKAGQRILAEALARELGPSGIHVAYVVIDAVIDMPFARKRMGDHPDGFYAKPDDLAGEIYRVAHQPRSAQSFLVELRPFGESW